MNNEDRNPDATLYVGNLDDKVSDALLWEFMLQAGPVVNVNIPRDRISALHQGFGFVEFSTEDDADYALKIMSMIKFFGKPIRLNKATAERRQFDVGASLFVGNLAPDVDEKMLYDTFSAFGTITQTPKISREVDSGLSKGYGFICFDSFDAADAAIESMNGQFLMNKPITLTYAYKKDGKGEKHGSVAERLLASQGKKNLLIPGFVGAGGVQMPAGTVPVLPGFVGGLHAGGGTN